MTTLLSEIPSIVLASQVKQDYPEFEQTPIWDALTAKRFDSDMTLTFPVEPPATSAPSRTGVQVPLPQVPDLQVDDLKVPDLST